jgi:lipid-binding SYLF domain-containing protein
MGGIMEITSMEKTRRSLLIAAPTLFIGMVTQGSEAHAASASQINADAGRALRSLYAVQPKARELGRRAKAVLIFPKIVKAGLVVGGQSGDGALLIGGRTTAYYNLSAASFGLQAGAETFSYALFFMTDSALDYLQKSDGWAIGSGPSVVVVDKGAAASLTSTTATQDVYAFPFGQRGLMAGLSLEGSKITRIYPVYTPITR